MTPQRPERSGKRWTVGLVRSGRLPALFIALACAATLYGFLASTDYQVDTVVVHGARIGDPGQVAGVSGALDRSIFRVDPDTAAIEIARLPWVAGASVRLETPDSLIVTLTERVPAAVWTDGQQSVLVDADGQVLFIGDDLALPRLAVTDPPPMPGEAVEARDVAAVAAIDAAFGDSLAVLRWSNDIGFSATLTDERVVVFGDAERTPLKVAALAAFVGHADVAWTVLDLSDPDRPYFR
jgi:cell division protein FtsQ